MQGHLDLGLVQSSFAQSPRMETPWPRWTTSSRAYNCSHWENIFLSIKSEFSMFQFVSVASHSLLLMLSLCNLQEKPGSVLSTPSHSWPVDCHGIPLSLLFSSVNKPSSLSLSSYNTCSSLQPSWWTSTGLTLAYQSLSCPDIVCQMWSRKCWTERKDQFTWLAGHDPAITAQYRLGFLCCKGTFAGLTFGLSTIRTPTSFSTKADF